MQWHSLVGLLLLAGSAYVGRDLMQDSKNPWPAYAEPQVDCALPLPGSYDGGAVRLQHPDAWKVSEHADKEAGIVQTYLTPVGGAPNEVILFLREVQARLSTVEVPSPRSAEGKLRDAAASTPPADSAGGQQQQPAEGTAPDGSVRLPNTDQVLELGQDRNGNAYLSRIDEGPQVSFSWMAFIWDKQGRTTVVSGPKLVHSNWPHHRQRGRKLNCAFWTVLKTVEAK